MKKINDKVSTTDALIIYLIHRLGGDDQVPVEVPYSTLAQPEGMLENFRIDFELNENRNVYLFTVHEIPRMAPDDRLDEAAELLDTDDSTPIETWHIERALWLITNGMKGRPNWDKYGPDPTRA